MKIDLSLKLVLKHFEKEVKKIDNFDRKFNNGTWNDRDIITIYNLQIKAQGLDKLDNLINITSSGNEYLHNELKIIKELVR